MRKRELFRITTTISPIGQVIKIFITIDEAPPDNDEDKPIQDKHQVKPPYEVFEIDREEDEDANYYHKFVLFRCQTLEGFRSIYNGDHVL